MPKEQYEVIRGTNTGIGGNRFAIWDIVKPSDSWANR
jgi:hypothetical protein